MEYFVNEGNKIGYMPTEFSNGSNGITEKKLIAGEDITKGQLVEVSGNLEVSVATAQSLKVLGVAMFDAKSGEPVSVECEGLFKLTSSAVVVAGAILESSGLGKVATKTTGQGIGIALSDGATDGPIYVKFAI